MHAGGQGFDSPTLHHIKIKMRMNRQIEEPIEFRNSLSFYKNITDKLFARNILKDSESVLEITANSAFVGR